MVGVRVIPCLLWKGGGLVKTIKFSKPTYIGDVTNAIRIFNEKEVDELMLMDIEASTKGKKPDLNLIRQIACECFMPICYGGGINTISDIRQILSLGVEKVSLNTVAVENPAFIKEAARAYGSSTIVVCIDYKRNLFGKPVITYKSGKEKKKMHPLDFALQMEEMGAGEIVLQSIDRDGTMVGYDTELIARIAEKLSVPVIALGGAGTNEHLKEVLKTGSVSAVAAGSMFVFKGRHRAVLINYPDRNTFIR